MFESSVSGYENQNKTMIKKRTSAYVLSYLLTLIVKELEISVEQSRVVTILNIIKH